MPVPSTRILKGKKTKGNKSTQSQSIIFVFPVCYLTQSIEGRATLKPLLQQRHFMPSCRVFLTQPGPDRFIRSSSILPAKLQGLDKQAEGGGWMPSAGIIEVIARQVGRKLAGHPHRSACIQMRPNLIERQIGEAVHRNCYSSVHSE